MPSEAMHHLIASLDVQGSGKRSNQEKLDMRKVVYAVIEQAFDAARISMGPCRIEDRGDGALITVPAHVPETRMVGVWVTEIYEELRARNRGLDESGRVRVRLGMHSGQVHHDDHGVAGADVDLACRLADSQVARNTLEGADAAHLVLIASNRLYESVVRHGGRFIDPDCYRQARVRLKETDTTAWIHVPGYSVPPLPSSRESRGPAKSELDTENAGNTTKPTDDQVTSWPHIGTINGTVGVIGHNEVKGNFIIGNGYDPEDRKDRQRP